MLFLASEFSLSLLPGNKFWVECGCDVSLARDHNAVIVVFPVFAGQVPPRVLSSGRHQVFGSAVQPWMPMIPFCLWTMTVLVLDAASGEGFSGRTWKTSI